MSIDTGGIVRPSAPSSFCAASQTLARAHGPPQPGALTLARYSGAGRRSIDVAYPGLPDHPQADVAQRQLRAGGGMLAVDLGTREQAASPSSTRCASPTVTATLGSVVTLRVHPATTSHRQLRRGADCRDGHLAGLLRVASASRTSRISSRLAVGLRRGALAVLRAPSHRSRSADAGLDWASGSRFGADRLADAHRRPLRRHPIIVLAVAGLIGIMSARSRPSRHGRSDAYAIELADLHRRYDPVSILGTNVGPTMVGVFERPGPLPHLHRPLVHRCC